MAWPNSELPVTVEMWNGSAWVDITSLVRTAAGITIRRGFPNEGRAAEPGSIEFVGDNRTGNLSPRNPNGTYYGLIGRNTPVRVTVGEDLAGGTWLEMFTEGVSSWNTGSPASTGGAAAIDVVGDLDVRWDGALVGWESGAALAGRFSALGANDRAWALLIDASGYLSLRWSPDGTSGAVVTATSTVQPGVESGQRMALRAALDVDNGAGGWTVTFYTSDTIDGSWTQLGAAVTDAGVTSIHALTGSVDLQVGDVYAFHATLARCGRVYGFELRDGINGTAVANPDFTGLQDAYTLDFAGRPTFTDAAGRTWLVTVETTTDEPVDAAIVDPGVRGVGEVSEWPSRWDVSGQDVTVPTVAQGVLRRLGQGDRPARSPLTAMSLQLVGSTINAYWSMEDRGGTSFASLIPGGPPMTYGGEAPEFAATGPILGSNAVAVLAATTSLSGDVPTADNGSGAARVLLDVPVAPGWADGTVIMRLSMNPTSGAGFWEIRYKTGGGLQVAALDHFGSALSTSGTLSANLDGRVTLLAFSATQDGVDVDWSLAGWWLDDDGEVDTATFGSGTVAGIIGHPVRIQIAPSGGLDGVGVGQVADGHGFPSTSPLTEVLVSYVGERAGHRADRLLRQNFAPGRFVKGIDSQGYLLSYDYDDGTVTMGAQSPPAYDDAGRPTQGRFADLFAETVTAEMALVYETRDELGVSWRTRRSLYNQAAALTLDYSLDGEVAPPLEPVDDDQLVVNDVEVTRKGGSFARAVDETSRLSVNAPPDGVGRYEASVEINTDSDDDLKHQAGWRLHLGTWDEQRYPTVHIDLRALAVQGKWSLIAAATQLDVGDRLVITNLPSWLPPENADLLCLGFTETIDENGFGWHIAINCRPYGPWDVGVVADTAPYLNTDVKRIAGDRACALREAIDTDDTSFDFDPNVCRWTTNADHFDDTDYEPFHVVVGGERMTPTAIATTAATYVAAGAASHADNAAVTPAMYAGAAADDWIVVVAGFRSTTGELSITSGYDLLVPAQGGLYVWAKVHDGSESDPVVTPSGGASGDTVSAATFGLRNMPTTLDDLADAVVRYSAQTNTSAANIAYPRLRRPKTDGCVVLLLARKSDDWTSVAVPGGFTEAVDSSSTSGNDQGLYAALQVQTTSAKVAPSSLTVTGGAAAVSDALVIALAGGFQTATVTRSVNGVVKSHAVGAEMAVYRPLRVAL